MKVITEIKMFRYGLLAMMCISALVGWSDAVFIGILISWAIFEAVGLLIEKMDGRN